MLSFRQFIRCDFVSRFDGQRSFVVLNGFRVLHTSYIFITGSEQTGKFSFLFCFIGIEHRQLLFCVGQFGGGNLISHFNDQGRFEILNGFRVFLHRNILITGSQKSIELGLHSGLIGIQGSQHLLSFRQFIRCDLVSRFDGQRSFVVLNGFRVLHTRYIFVTGCEQTGEFSFQPCLIGIRIGQQLLGIGQFISSDPVTWLDDQGTLEITDGIRIFLTRYIGIACCKQSSVFGFLGSSAGIERCQKLLCARQFLCCNFISVFDGQCSLEIFDGFRILFPCYLLISEGKQTIEFSLQFCLIRIDPRKQLFRIGKFACGNFIARPDIQGSLEILDGVLILLN